MDYTSRMLALLRELRRERNGAVADSMRYYGTPYGLNYGVSLPTLRRIARAEAPDHGFARYLYRQDVRELRLAALHIACPACLTPEEFAAWAEALPACTSPATGIEAGLVDAAARERVLADNLTAGASVDAPGAGFTINGIEG